MSDLTAFDPPPSPPPPSYEISQYEFDQKTSHILEESARDPPQRRVDEDGFEVWDEAVFEAALNGMSTLSVGQSSSSSDRRASTSSAIPPPPFSSATGSEHSSSYPPEKQRARPLPPSGHASSSGSESYAGSASSSAGPSFHPQEVRPLRVQKKTRPQKERPAWYAEAGLGGGSPPPSPLEPQPSGSSSHTPQAPQQPGPPVLAHPEREGTPPPEFSPVGPSLDGPPYESLVMTYEGEPLPPGPAPMGSPEPPAFSPAPPPTPPALSPPPPATPPAFSPPPPTVQPPSPPSAPSHLSHAHLRSHAETAYRQTVHSQSLPQRPVSSASSAPRPPASHHQSMLFANPQSQPRPTSFYPGGQPNAPRVPFNPQMAYSKPLLSSSPSRAGDAGPQATEPSSFYSHAVSAHYSYNVPVRMRKQTLAGEPAQPEQPQQFPHMGMGAPPNSFGANSDKGGPPVASPRPNYGYSQAKFNDAASIYSQSSGTTNNWGYGGQPGWPPAGGGYQSYR